MSQFDREEITAVHARFTFHTADPARLGEVISHYEHDVTAAFTHEPGYRGMSVLANDDLGVVLIEAYWATEQEMRSNDATFVRPVHDAAFFGATVSIEHYEVASFVHVTPAAPGAAVNLTRLDAESTRLDDVRAAYGEVGLGALTDCDGFSSAVLLVDSKSGRAVVDTTWRDGQALRDARGAIAAGRLEAVSKGTVTVRGIEQYRLDYRWWELE